MKSLIATAAPFLPLLVSAAGFSGIWRGRALWVISLLAHSATWVCFTGILSALYLKGGDGVVESVAILEATRWSPALSFRWDFWSTLLAWASVTTLVSLHFLTIKSLQESRALPASVGAFLACVLGTIGSQNLFLFCIALAGSMLPKFVMICLDQSESSISIAMESTVMTGAALFGGIIVVLAITGSGSIPEWLSISGSDSEVSPGTIGFFLILFSALAVSGIFPFHSTTRKIFGLSLADVFCALTLQFVVGFLLLFRFGSAYFPDQLKTFSGPLLYFYSTASFVSAMGFWGAESARDRIFWLQQVLGGFAMIGFFSLSHKGWHGSSTLIAFQAMAIPVLLLLSVCHDRRGGLLSGERIGSYPWLGAASIFAPLIALCSPLSLGFYCLILIFWSLADKHGLAIPIALSAVPVCAFAGMRIMFFRLGTLTQPDVALKSEFDFTASEKAAVLPSIAILLMLGVVPGLLLSPIGVAVIAMLKGLKLGF